MDSDKINFFKLASSRMHWLAERQEVVSGNIANANTAGFRARDVDSFEAYLQRNLQSPQTAPVEVQEVRGTWNTSLSGNNVVLEEQMVLATDTADKHRLASNLYKKAHQLILAASGSR